MSFTQNQAVLQLEEYKQPYWPSTKQVLIMISLESKRNKFNLYLQIYSNNRWVVSKKLYLWLIDLEMALYQEKEKT